jgi:hypothetical protein
LTQFNFLTDVLVTIDHMNNPSLIDRATAPLITALLLAGCLVISPSSLAQESKEEIKAARCSAIFTMLAEALPEDPDTMVFQRFIRLFNELYLQEKKERTGSANAEDGESRRAFLLKEFRETYASREGALKEEVVLCGAWGDAYLAQGDNVTHVPVIPKLIPASVRQKYEALAAEGWSRWLK